MIIVISDIHIGAGVLDDCDAELERELTAFLAFLSQEYPSAELVINGDFLDFAQAFPWQGSELESDTLEGIPLCSSESQSQAKFSSIASSHPAIFKGLGQFLESDTGSRLTILPGNHD